MSFQKRIAAGEFVVLAEMHTPKGVKTFAGFMKKAKTLNIPVIPTVFLIKSLAIAQYIVNSEPGTSIPDELIRRIRKSSDREREGIKIAGETVASLKDMADGVLLQTSAGSTSYRKFLILPAFKGADNRNDNQNNLRTLQE